MTRSGLSGHRTRHDVAHRVFPSLVDVQQTQCDLLGYQRMVPGNLPGVMVAHEIRATVTDIADDESVVGEEGGGDGRRRPTEGDVFAHQIRELAVGAVDSDLQPIRGL